VTFDGEPVPTGAIKFTPTDGTAGPTTGAKITNGSYTISASQGATVGPNRVEIVAAKKTGRKVPDANQPGKERDETVQMIPAKYNTNSELKKTVTTGTNTIDFDLTSK